MKCQMTTAAVAAADDDDQIWAQSITLNVIIARKTWAVRVDVEFLRRIAAEVHRMNFRWWLEYYECSSFAMHNWERTTVEVGHARKTLPTVECTTFHRNYLPKAKCRQSWWFWSFHRYCLEGDEWAWNLDRGCEWCLCAPATRSLYSKRRETDWSWQIRPVVVHSHRSWSAVHFPLKSSPEDFSSLWIENDSFTQIDEIQFSLAK